MAIAISGKVRIAYIRLRRRIMIFFTLWFLAILLAVSLIISSFFVFNNFLLKLWAIILILMMCTKIAYDAALGIKKQYEQFKEDTGQTDASLQKIMEQPKQGQEPQQKAPKEPESGQGGPIGDDTKHVEEQAKNTGGGSLSAPD
ncbi:MAG: hypothetical protein ACREBH_00010 [Candidatus Micrarchaeaceae archaeon]